MHFLMNRYIIILLYIFSQIYLMNRMLFWLRLSFPEQTVYAPLRIITIILTTICALSLPLGTYLPEHSWKYRFQAYGNIWFAFFAGFGSVLLLVHIVTTIKRLITGSQSVLFTPIVARGLFLGFLFFSIGWIIYGMYHAKRPVVTHTQISLHKKAELPNRMLRIALLADYHLGVNSSLSHIRKVVEMTNEQHPDVIFVAGDIISSTFDGIHDPDAFAAELSKLHARYGIYAVYGNHDVEENLLLGFPTTRKANAYRSPKLDPFMKQAGMQVLEDQMVEIADGQIQLVGRLDQEKPGYGPISRKSASKLLSGIDPSKPTLVLEHEPVEYRTLAKSGVDLVLSGHTHNGQIFPANLFVPFFNENGYGLKKIDGMETFVTAGVGFYGPPMRIGTNSEISILDVQFES